MNQITTYREKPLTMEEFSRLEAYAEKFITVKEKLISKSVPKVDTNGEVYGWERDLVPQGTEVFFKAEPDERLMDSLQRPATRQAIGVHLQRLYDHRPYGRGDSGWLTVVEDLIHDLNGCSEWSILKTCETFRLQRGARFFPETADLVHVIKALDEGLRWAYAARPSTRKIEAPQPERIPAPTDEGRARVAKALHDVGLPHDKTFCAQCVATHEQED